eukprot:133020-Prymnesium_polylepis.1
MVALVRASLVGVAAGGQAAAGGRRQLRRGGRPQADEPAAADGAAKGDGDGDGATRRWRKAVPVRVPALVSAAVPFVCARSCQFPSLTRVRACAVPRRRWRRAGAACSSSYCRSCAPSRGAKDPTKTPCCRASRCSRSARCARPWRRRRRVCRPTPRGVTLHAASHAT